MKKFIQFLAGKPVIFNTIRSIVEVNHISLKQVIRNEFSLLTRSEQDLAGEKVLDVPCGTGEFCMLFHPGSYLGVDISKTYIDYAQKKYKRTFQCCDALRSGFDGHYFDKILMIGFLHHLDDSSVVSVLNEMKRILKPDGTLLLIEDAPITNKYNVMGRVILNNDIGSNIRTRAEYGEILEESFFIKKHYQVSSGLFNYSVFALSPLT